MPEEKSQPLGWIELPDGRWAGGTYHLLPTFEWAGTDRETVDFLNSAYTLVRFPGHGGAFPGADVIAAAADEMKAVASQVGPERDPGQKPDAPDIVH